MQNEAKAEVAARLKKVAGQVAGVQRMVENDRYCVDILTQIAAIRSALDVVGVQLLTDHIQNCVAGHGSGSEHPQTCAMSQDELVAEVGTTLKRFLR